MNFPWSIWCEADPGGERLCLGSPHTASGLWPGRDTFYSIRPHLDEVWALCDEPAFTEWLWLVATPDERELFSSATNITARRWNEDVVLRWCRMQRWSDVWSAESAQLLENLLVMWNSPMGRG